MDSPLIGEIRLIGFSAVPDGWSACNGQELSIREHPDLYRVIGLRYGGDGRTTFALPDLRGKAALQTEEVNYPLGSSGGEAVHALTLEELPAHQHRLAASTRPASPSGAGRARPAAVSGVAYSPAAELTPLSVVSQRSAPISGHDNMQPYLGLQFIIALTGRWPADI